MKLFAVEAGPRICKCCGDPMTKNGDRGGTYQTWKCPKVKKRQNSRRVGTKKENYIGMAPTADDAATLNAMRGEFLSKQREERRRQNVNDS